MVTKKRETELIYLEKEIFNNYLYVRMYKSGETPLVLWIHETFLNILIELK